MVQIIGLDARLYESPHQASSVATSSLTPFNSTLWLRRGNARIDQLAQAVPRSMRELAG